MTTLYTPEEREAKLETLKEAVYALNHEQLVALNRLIDKLMADYQRKQAEGEKQ